MMFQQSNRVEQCTTHFNLGFQSGTKSSIHRLFFRRANVCGNHESQYYIGGAWLPSRHLRIVLCLDWQCLWQLRRLKNSWQTYLPQFLKSNQQRRLAEQWNIIYHQISRLLDTSSPKVYSVEFQNRTCLRQKLLQIMLLFWYCFKLISFVA